MEPDGPEGGPGHHPGPVDPPTTGSVVLAHVGLVAGVEVDLPDGGVAAGPRPDVDRGDVGAEGRTPARVAGPTLPVSLLGVEEELIVERADLLQCLPSHHQHRADHEVDPPAQDAE